MDQKKLYKEIRKRLKRDKKRKPTDWDICDDRRPVKAILIPKSCCD